VKGRVWKRQRQESRKMKSQVKSMLRQVTMGMRGQDGLPEREEDERSEGSVWMTLRHTVKNGFFKNILTLHKKNST
jgi:hypothetical protein